MPDAVIDYQAWSTSWCPCDLTDQIEAAFTDLALSFDILVRNTTRPDQCGIDTVGRSIMPTLPRSRTTVIDYGKPGEMG